MNLAPDWWMKPRRVSVVVDNPSWILPWAEKAVEELNATGEEASLVRSYSGVSEGSVAFFFGCVGLCPDDVLRRNRRNLVVHASDLPKDRGFSPWTWAILEGESRIPVCLLEADGAVDSGAIYFRDIVEFEGHELVDELRARIGEMHVKLAASFMSQEAPPVGRTQTGEATWRRRRRQDDSRLDPDRSLAEQFNLLRVVDNDRYPAFFELRGHRYIVSISKHSEE